MKKLIFPFIGALLLLTISQCDVFAQEEIQKGDFILSPGLGFGYNFNGGITIGVNGEYAFSDEISGGGYAAFTHWGGYNYYYGTSYYSYDINYLDIGARASYHFGKLLKVPNKKFDPYAGAQIGFAIAMYDDAVGSNPYDGGVRGGLYAGARWYFNEQVGVFGEVGFALCPIMLGATFKF
ncbi:MAG TPA: hypothetical protein VK666_09525 [Chryseolinea sp.]|nr:hypothetical protein [Chryseolinea sp.]